MKRLIRSIESSSITCSKTVKIKDGKFAGTSCTVITQAQCDARKNLTKQFKKEGFTFYSAPGAEQYTWKWYAVPNKTNLDYQ